MPPRSDRRAPRRPILAALAALALGAFPAAAGAQPPAGAPPMGGGRGAGMQAMLFEGITLTDAQRATVDSVQQAQRARVRDRMASMRQGAAPPDSAARATTRQEMMRAAEQDRAAMRAVLTADQQKTFDANVARMQEAQRARMSRGPGGRER